MRRRLDSWEKNYSQEGDGWSGDDQTITIGQDDCGGGDYWWIKTDRWAFDSIDELIELLEQAGVPRRAVPELPRPVPLKSETPT